MERLDARFVLGVVTLTAILAALRYLIERDEYRRLAGFVRTGLVTKRCARCGGELGVWDGRLARGDIHFSEWGYLPRVQVSCTRCHAEQVFYVRSGGQLISRDDLTRQLPSNTS